MISILVLFKKYKIFFERLILYMAVSLLLYQSATLFDLSALVAYTSNETDVPATQYCAFIGFFKQNALWWYLMSILFIAIATFVQVVFKWSIGVKFEVATVITIFVLPFLFNWVPFIELTYGPTADLYCWIQVFTIKRDPDWFGIGATIALYFIPASFITVTVLVLFFITLATIRRRKKNWAIRSRDVKNMYNQLQSEVAMLLVYPVTAAICNGLSIIAYIILIVVSEGSLVEALVVLQLMLFRSQGLVMTVVFLCQSENRQLLKWTKIKGAFYECCCSRKKGRNATSYMIPKECMTDSKLLDNSTVG
jgi:hypothetical protein